MVCEINCGGVLYLLIMLIKNIRYINFTNDISYDTIKKTNIQAVSAVDQAVAAGMIAAPTAAANAASVSAWDQVAACESGGNWQTNTGNGYYGGLQFSQQTWSGHGGDQYAPTADQATKEQQIEIGERVLASQGAGAWPNCGGPLG